MYYTLKIKKKFSNVRNKNSSSLVVWRLGLCAFTAGGPGPVSGLGTNIPQAVHIAKKTKPPATGPCYLTVLSFKTLES